MDAKNKLIAAFEVTNAGSDFALLPHTASAANEALEAETIQSVNDRSYDEGEAVQACEDAGIEAYVARAQRVTDRRSYAERAACRSCAIRPQCIGTTHRVVARWVDEAVLDRMEQRLAPRPNVLHRRRETVEHPFGSIKQWTNQGAFLMRSLE